MSKSMKLLAIIVAVIALLLGLLVSKYQTKSNQLSDTLSSTVFSPPQDIAQFALVDTKGRPFNNNSLWGHWTFLFFGFTQCTQICPPEMSNLNKIYTLLLQQQQNPMPQFVFISVDPDNDTLEKIGQYVTSFNPHFQGATGDKAEIDKLAASLNVLYIKTIKDKKTGETTFDHSGTILLIDPSGKLIAIFSMPHDPVAIAKDFQLIVKNSG
jgi:protein SCO1/2